MRLDTYYLHGGVFEVVENRVSRRRFRKSSIEKDRHFDVNALSYFRCSLFSFVFFFIILKGMEK